MRQKDYHCSEYPKYLPVFLTNILGITTSSSNLDLSTLKFAHFGAMTEPNAQNHDVADFQENLSAHTKKRGNEKPAWSRYILHIGNFIHNCSINICFILFLSNFLYNVFMK